MKVLSIILKFFLIFLLANSIESRKCQDDLCVDSAQNNSCIQPIAGKYSHLDGENCSANCDDSDKCIVNGYFYCVIFGGTTTKNASTKLCECLGTECFHLESNSCVTMNGTNNLTKDSDGVCACSAANSCYLPDSKNCVAVGSTFHSSSVDKECYCIDINNCINSSDQCVATNDSSNPQLFSNGDGKRCVAQCAVNQCWVSGINICHTPSSSTDLVDVSTGAVECECATTTNCYNSSSKSCIVRGNGLESPEKSCKCAAGNCFIPDSTVACIPNNVTGFSTTVRECQCDNLTHCLVSSGCISPTSTLSSNNDGKVCYSYSAGTPSKYCADTDKCFNENTFVCMHSFENLRSTSVGGKCMCKETNKCYSGSTCDAPSSGKISRNDGLICYTNCQAGYCFDEDDFYCKQKGVSSGTTASTGQCVCSNTRQCYTVSSNTIMCQNAASGRISDKDGSKCQASTCTDTTKCYHPLIYLCQPGKSGFTTGGVCLRNQMFEITNYINNSFDTQVIHVKMFYSLETISNPRTRTSNKELYVVLRNERTGLIDNLTYQTNLPQENKNFFENFIVNMNMIPNNLGKQAQNYVIYDFSESCEGTISVIKFKLQYFTCDNKFNNFVSALTLSTRPSIVFKSNGIKEVKGGPIFDAIYDVLIGHNIKTCVVRT